MNLAKTLKLSRHLIFFFRLFTRFYFLSLNQYNRAKEPFLPRDGGEIKPKQRTLNSNKSEVLSVVISESENIRGNSGKICKYQEIQNYVVHLVIFP